MWIVALLNVTGAAVQWAAMHGGHVSLGINRQRYLIAVGEFACQVGERVARHAVRMWAALL